MCKEAISAEMSIYVGSRLDNKGTFFSKIAKSPINIEITFHRFNSEKKMSNFMR